jgi:dephospho-CoA kinase
MLVVGLTGGIATGKSTVSGLLRKKHIPIIDADVIARQVVEPGQPAYLAILEAFASDTPDLFLEDKTLNRPALGRRIFGDDAARNTLNSITHPAVRKAMMYETLRAYIRGAPLCILDVPLLFEGGLDAFCGINVCVACSDTEQRRRLQLRDTHLLKEDAEARIKSQMSMQEKRTRADYVIDNEGTLQDLERNVDALLEQIRPWQVVSLLEWLVPPFGLTMGIWTLLSKRLMKPKARL